MASLTLRTWLWASSRRQWCTDKPGVLHVMQFKSQTRLSDWTTVSTTPPPSCLAPSPHCHNLQPKAEHTQWWTKATWNMGTPAIRSFAWPGPLNQLHLNCNFRSVSWLTAEHGQLFRASLSHSLSLIKSLPCKPQSWQVYQFSSVAQSRLFATPWTAACQASLSITNSQSLLKLMSVESVMPSNHLILCCPLLLLSSVFPSNRVFSKE